MIPGDGRVVIGRCLTNVNIMHGSVVVDELTLWNHVLSSEEINAIYNKH